MIKPIVHIAVIGTLFVSATANACVPPLVEFAFGSAQVPNDGQDDVSQVIRMARAAPHMRVRLTATTDGSKPNVRMSRRRVEAIKAVLAGGGVPRDRIDVEYVLAVSDGSARIVMMEVVSGPTCAA